MISEFGRPMGASQHSIISILKEGDPKLDFSISLRSIIPVVDIRPTVPIDDPQPDPLASVRKFLTDMLPALGRVQFLKGVDCWFYNASQDSGGGTIIGDGFQPQQITRLDDDWWLVEGISGGAINIGDLAPGESAILEPSAFRMAKLLGPQEAMFNRERIELALDLLAESPRWMEVGRSFDAIGFGIWRTNDPLIS